MLNMTFNNTDSIHCSRDCYFFDCGEVSQTVSKIYGESIPIHGFISDDIDLHGKFLNGRRIYSLDEVLKNRSNYIIIATNRDIEKISERLISLGLKPQIDFCHYKDWIRKYFETLLDEKNRLVQDYLELYLTDRCTLRCKECILFAPYVSKPRDRDLVSVEKDLDTYFKFVDRVSVFRLMGGEPFLFNDIEKLLLSLNHYN